MDLVELVAAICKDWAVCASNEPDETITSPYFVSKRQLLHSPGEGSVSCPSSDTYLSRCHHHACLLRAGQRISAHNSSVPTYKGMSVTDGSPNDRNSGASFSQSIMETAERGSSHSLQLYTTRMHAFSMSAVGDWDRHGLSMQLRPALTG